MLAAIATTLLLHHETAPELCCGWKETSNVDNSTLVSFTVHAKESNRKRLEAIALDVSNPDSNNYGQYLSSATIDALTAPSEIDMSVISNWLATTMPDASVTVTRGRKFHVELPVASAEKALNTTFLKLSNTVTHQTATRSSDFTVPRQVKDATDTILGLHGLPLPPKQLRQIQAPPSAPANVTPAVIISQYNVDGVTPTTSSNNIQAVAEFQGQTMSSKDLSEFFKQYVPNAPSGSDTVSKFVGDNGDKSGQTEASLDIQYIMGVAPGIATEFWLYDPNDFCGDLKNWTESLLSAKAPPLVTSVSYGWQGKLTQIGCKDSDMEAVDADFAKLAAKGLTIIFASGDSGSGYTPSQPSCANHDHNTEFTGVVRNVVPTQSFSSCCLESGPDAEGFTFDGTDAPPAPQKCTPAPKNTAYEGTVIQTFKVQAADVCCLLSNDFKGKGYTYDGANCTVFKTITGKKTQAGATSGMPDGSNIHNCTIFSKVTGKKTVTGKTSSKPAASGAVELYPSWPASSPWVTAVGATRFVGNKAGNEEMATDQFGSGGGFSKQFDQSPNAKWQSAVVANYLNVVPKGAPFPPTASFPALGRATPDVCALGEGFQVVQNGNVIAVGGTSASAPTFAGLVSLLNEARLQAGKKPLGFLNEFLYQNMDSFTDVTKGTNAIGRGTGPIKYGFNATKSWDPATGLGSMNFKKLLAAAMALK